MDIRNNMGVLVARQSQEGNEIVLRDPNGKVLGRVRDGYTYDPNGNKIGNAAMLGTLIPHK